MNKVEDLSLLIYLTVINHVSLPKIMAKWSGYIDEEYYNENVQIELYKTAISDINNSYHIPISKYFESKRSQKVSELFNEKYKYSEIEALKSCLFWIHTNVWSDEDKKRLKELKKEYIDEELENGR